MRPLHLSLTIEEEPRLQVVFGKLFGSTPHLVDGRVAGLDRFRKRPETGCARLKRAAASQRVRFIRDASSGNRLPMQPVALVVMHGNNRGVDWNLVKIGAAQPRDLRIDVRMIASGQ